MNIQNVLASFPKHIQNQLIPVTFEKGETIIRKGDDVIYAFFFTEGSCDVIEEDYQERRFMISKGSNSPFACLMDIFSGHDTQCTTLVAATRCKGYKLHRKYMMKLLDTPCLFQPFLIRHWASMFYDTTMNMRRYPIYQTEEKLIALIKENNGSISNARDDLAALLGCSRRTLFRVLRKMKNDGIITTSGSRITVTEMGRLRTS